MERVFLQYIFVFFFPIHTYQMISNQTLLLASIVIKTIENALNELDPYNHQFPDPDDSLSIRDCDFPEQVQQDPLQLVRELRGEEYTKQLEYADDLEYTLRVISDCLREELARTGKHESDLQDDESDEEAGSEIQ